MIDIVGWIGTLLVLIGYILNANRKYLSACIIWIIGDITWIAYDVHRGIYPHLGLCLVIISINLYAIVKMSVKGLRRSHS